MKSKVYNTVLELVKKLDETQDENIEKGARLIADAIEKGGMLQAYGVGESISGALDMCQRAGGFVPSKCLQEYSVGEYQDIEGAAAIFYERVDMRDNDVFILFSNSGRNPLPIDMVIEAKKRGASTIVVSSMATSKNVKSKHSSGKNAYEFADVAIDSGVGYGDAMISIEGFDRNVCAMSTIACTTIAQELVYRAVEMMLKDGYEPPIAKSRNIDGGIEYNNKLKAKYFDRLWHL